MTMFSFPSRMCIFLRKRPQNEGTRNMATLKAISIRLKSVKNIQKITQSMKMVSAAKFSRAERELKQIKPLGEGAKLFYTNAEVEPPDAEKSSERDLKTKKKIVYIAVTSDRGLCGAVHSSVAKFIQKAIIDSDDSIGIVCIGDKSRTLLQRLFKTNFLFVCHEVGRLPPTFRDASVIANEILQMEFDKAKIVYNKFRSVVSNVTEELQFYNLDTILQSSKSKLLEDADLDTISSFVEFSVVTLIFYALKEGACSEQAARMTAMDNASKNAGDMISNLTLTFNRTRQALITRELIEIISGASAL